MANHQLLLLRHAKAVIGDGVEDFDRPLAPRGEEASQLIGRYMASSGLAPDLVLCSPARRTRQTWDIASRELPPVTVHHIPALYDFGDGEALLQVIRDRGGAARRLLLVTHNPATQHLALSLAGAGNPAQRRQLLEKYPTAGLAVLSPSVIWAELGDGLCHLDAFIRPRDLA